MFLLNTRNINCFTLIPTESLCIGGIKAGPPVVVEQSGVFQARSRTRLTSEESSLVPAHRRGGISSGSVRRENNNKRTERIPKDQRSRDSLSRVFNTNIFFSHLDSEERSEICDALVQLSARPGDLIIRQGEEGDTFYIIDLVMDLPIYISLSSNITPDNRERWRLSLTGPLC